MKEIIVQEAEAGQRLDRLLSRYLKEASRGFLYKMLRKKNITLNGKKAQGREIVRAKDRIRLFCRMRLMSGLRGSRNKRQCPIR